MEGCGSKIRFSAYRRLGDIIFLVLDYGLFRSQVPLTETNHVNCDWTPFMERHIFDSITTAGLCIDANIRARMFTRAIQTVTYSDAETYALLRFSCSFLVLALMLTDRLYKAVYIHVLTSLILKNAFKLPCNRRKHTTKMLSKGSAFSFCSLFKGSPLK